MINGCISLLCQDTALGLNFKGCIPWAWHGDYLNLGAGAEIGVYFRPSCIPSNPDGLDQYYVLPGFIMPMQLYLYENNNSEFTNIVSWEPSDDQWWITGFNP